MLDYIPEKFIESYHNIKVIDLPIFNWNDVILIYPMYTTNDYTTYSIIVLANDSTEEYIHRYTDIDNIIKYVNPKYKPTCGYKKKKFDGSFEMLNVIAEYNNHVFYVPEYGTLSKLSINDLIKDNTIRNLNLL